MYELMVYTYQIRYRIKNRKYDRNEADVVKLRSTTIEAAQQAANEEFKRRGLDVDIRSVAKQKSDN